MLYISWLHFSPFSLIENALRWESKTLSNEKQGEREKEIERERK